MILTFETILKESFLISLCIKSLLEFKIFNNSVENINNGKILKLLLALRARHGWARPGLEQNYKLFI